MESQKEDILRSSLFLGVTRADQFGHQTEPLPYATNQYSQPLQWAHKAHCINCSTHVLPQTKFYGCSLQRALITYFPYGIGGYS